LLKQSVNKEEDWIRMSETSGGRDRGVLVDSLEYQQSIFIELNS